jgi:hypothetical protein
VGPQTSVTARHTCHDGDEFDAIVEQFRADWNRPVTWDIEDIARLTGDGWTLYLTTETDYSREDSKHCLYVVMPDEHMLIQCKLACL